MGQEKRFLPAETSEIRVESEGGKRKITGYAAVFNRKSENLGFFEEIIKPGAFKSALDDADVRCLFNHDPNYVLGRTTNGTLRLEENSRGLKFETDLPDTSWAQDLAKTIERGDVNQCSFSFRIAKGGETWTESNDDKPALREITEIAELGDVGPVTFPAYPQTTVQARSALKEAGLDLDSIASVITRAQRGLKMTNSDRDLIDASIMVLQDLLPQEEQDGGDAGTRESGDAARLQSVLTELELLEIKHNRKGDQQ